MFLIIFKEKEKLVGYVLLPIEVIRSTDAPLTSVNSEGFEFQESHTFSAGEGHFSKNFLIISEEKEKLFQS